MPTTYGFTEYFEKEVLREGSTSRRKYFEKEVLRKRPYVTKDLCVRVVQQPVRAEPQERNGYRFWALVPELGNRYLRVITLADRVTIHNAFLDRRFKP